MLARLPINLYRPILNSLRRPLRRVDQERSSQFDRVVVSDLLAALTSHPVARKLQSRLAIIYARLVSNDLEMHWRA